MCGSFLVFLHIIKECLGKNGLMACVKRLDGFR